MCCTVIIILQLGLD